MELTDASPFDDPGTQSFSSSIYQQPAHSSLAREYYRINSTNEGLVLIFNQTEFKKSFSGAKRRKTSNEGQLLKETLKKLNFKVENVFDDLTSDEIQNILRKSKFDAFYLNVLGTKN